MRIENTHTFPSLCPLYEKIITQFIVTKRMHFINKYQ